MARAKITGRMQTGISRPNEAAMRARLAQRLAAARAALESLEPVVGHQPSGVLIRMNACVAAIEQRIAELQRLAAPPESSSSSSESSSSDSDFE
jgi:hypothetical protein